MRVAAAQTVGTQHRDAEDASEWLSALEMHASQRPGHPAVVEIAADGETLRSITCGAFHSLLRARAGALSARFEAGATLIAALPSGIDLATWMAASLTAGMRLVLMHPRCVAGECQAVASKTEAAGLLASAQGLEWRGSCAVVDPASGLDTGPAALSAPPGSFVLGSSGTTGLPKLVERRSVALDADARAVAHGLTLRADDEVLCVAPISHSYGLDLLLGVLLAGATLRVMTEFDALGAARQLELGVTVLPGVPFVFESLARLPGKGAPRLRLVVSAGSPLTERVRREFTPAWEIEVGQLYGATELGTVMIHRPDEHGFDPVSIGRPLPGVSARVLRPGSDEALPAGTEGQLAVRAPSMLSRYLDGDLELVDGHFLTGDLARADDAGRIYLTGRLKLLIDVGGFKVNPLEVEQALLEHPGVAECAVGALDMSDTIRRVRAWYVAADPAAPPTDRQLREFLKTRLSSNKVPRLFERLERLPRSPMGKLLRDRLPGACA